MEFKCRLTGVEIEYDGGVFAKFKDVESNKRFTIDVTDAVYDKNISFEYVTLEDFHSEVDDTEFILVTANNSDEYELDDGSIDGPELDSDSLDNFIYYLEEYVSERQPDFEESDYDSKEDFFEDRFDQFNY